MIAKQLLMVITVGACLMGLTALGSLKNPVTHPNKGHGYATNVVSLSDGSFVASEQGQGTHTGKYVTHMIGQMDLATGTVIWGKGYLTAANGDQLFLEMTPSDVFYITGGTGRFGGATGRATALMSDMKINVDLSTMTMTITATDTIEGTITY